MELLVYGVVVTVMVGLLVSMSVNILAGRGKMVAMEEISYNARLVMGKITYEIRRSEQITSPLAGASSSSLSLVDADGDTLVFRLDPEEESVLQMVIGGGTPVSLTGESVVVSNLQFSNVSYQNGPGTIRMEMTLEFANPLERPEWDFQRTFYATENLRR